MTVRQARALLDLLEQVDWHGLFVDHQSIVELKEEAERVVELSRRERS